MNQLLFLLTILALAFLLNIFSDIWFSWFDPAHEEQLAGQRERFGISENEQDYLIDRYGYPGYIEELTDYKNG